MLIQQHALVTHTQNVLRQRTSAAVSPTPKKTLKRCAAHHADALAATDAAAAARCTGSVASAVETVAEPPRSLPNSERTAGAPGCGCVEKSARVDASLHTRGGRTGATSLNTRGGRKGAGGVGNRATERNEACTAKAGGDTPTAARAAALAPCKGNDQQHLRRASPTPRLNI